MACLAFICFLEAITPANGQRVAPWRASRKEGNFKQQFSEFNALLKLVQDCATRARVPEVQAAATLDQKLFSMHSLTLHEILKWITNKGVDGNAQILEQVLQLDKVDTPTPAKKKRTRAEQDMQG